MTELKSKINGFDDDADVPSADYPDEVADNGMQQSSENNDKDADESDTDTLHGDDTADNADAASKIAKGETSKISNLSMFGNANGA